VILRFNYDDDWRMVELECPTCHWKGTFEQGSVEYYAELMECSCPKCSFLTVPILAIVSRPTVAEMNTSDDPESSKQVEGAENESGNPEESSG
jgi:hypothetical protein